MKWSVSRTAPRRSPLSGDIVFDLLVDFAVPVMNGAEVAAEAVRLRPHLPVLFTTGYADTAVLQSWMQLGYRTLNKPFSAADLELAIRQTIRGAVTSCQWRGSERPEAASLIGEGARADCVGPRRAD
jgi:FixJ family two-component response regulator